MRKNEKITALYERLSRDDFGKDDDQQRESNSISNQKAMLEEFAARQGFTNIVHFTDDGITAEKNALYNEYRANKERVRELQTMKSNLSQMHHGEPSRQKKQEQER